MPKPVLPVRSALVILLALACAAPALAASSAPVAPAAPAPAPVKKLSVKAEPASDAAAPAPVADNAAKSAARPAAAPIKAAAEADPGQSYIKPFPGSRITERSVRGFDEYWMALGRLAGEAQADKVETLEGRWIHAGFVTPAGPSVAEVFRHYEQQVARAGFDVQYACKGVECGEGGRKTNGDWWGLSDHRRYLAARLARPNGDLWVCVHVHARGPTAPVEHEIDVIEARPPAVPPVPRNEAEVTVLEKELKSDGRVVLRQIAFSDGRPAVLPKSEPVVKAIADLLARDPGLKLHVVAHSDDTAPWNASMDLTKKRAAAVVALLTHKYHVAASRVQAAGVGPLAPVASNATEDGRAQNRRVELVPQPGTRGNGPAASRR